MSVILKSPAEIEAMKAAGQLSAQGWGACEAWRLYVGA